MAPELHVSGEKTKAADVYAFAISLWEIVKGMSAFDHIPAVALPHKVVSGVRPDLANLEPLTSSICNDGWAALPSNRPGFDEILDRLEKEQYKITPDVNSAEVSKYVANLRKEERALKPRPLQLQRYSPPGL
jgi:hypothetical protein